MELIISICAVLVTMSISLAAWIQTHNNVRPFLHSDADLTEDDVPNLKVSLHNSGSGPAILSDFYVFYDGKEYREDDIHSLFANNFEDVSVTVLRPNGAIKAGDQIELLAISTGKPDQTLEKLQHVLHNDYALKVKYKSFLGHNLKLFGRFDISFLGYEELYDSSDHRIANLELNKAEAE